MAEPRASPGPSEATAPRLQEQLLRIRAATEALTASLSAEDCQPQSMPDASPVKWHLAHTNWFFAEFVLAPAGGAPWPDEPWRRLFNSYYESVGPQHVRRSAAP